MNQWLKYATKRLEAAGVETARLDCLVLLEDVTGKDRAWLLANPDFHVSQAYFHELEELIERREKHEPLAYIREKTEFYGRNFVVNADVLEPRPETEAMIELLIRQAEGYEELRIIDVGTGSGALAITAKLMLPQAEVFAIDIDSNCLELAAKNAEMHEANITFVEGNLLEPLLAMDSETPTIVLANLPYVPDNYLLNEAAALEPSLAIFGGKDGLELYREMFTQTEGLLYPPQFILTESLPFQHEKLADIASAHNFMDAGEEDFIQLFELFDQF